MVKRVPKVISLLKDTYHLDGAWTENGDVGTRKRGAFRFTHPPIKDMY